MDDGTLVETRYLPLIIGVDDKGDVRACADGAHGAHADGEEPSRMLDTVGRRVITNVSKKLGFATTRSVETEVVSSGERFLKRTWFRHFRLAQGDNSKEDVLFQDNKSCMHLHKNCPFSIGNGSKHANVRCFFVVDNMEKKDAKMMCCPTENMVDDYSAKPTQGILFAPQRNLILGTNEEEFSKHKE